MVEINEKSVSAVLLNDGWHQLIEGTFRIEDIRIRADAAGTDFGKSSVMWEEHSTAAAGSTIAVSAPLTSVLAIQQKK